MELTPEMIEEFEKRADAGDKPVMEWTPTINRPFFNVWSGVCLLHLSVYAVREKRAPEETTRWELWNEIAPRDPVVLRSQAAAQLLAESLLRAATAPLHHSVGSTDMIRRDVALKAMELAITEADRITANLHGREYHGAKPSRQLCESILARAESKAGK